ncbi:hypothetical protein [Roseateles sp.]|uniref:hypothetical protein n=1 Tax=Roseateles sp. TaxID=1971397 RepID=UPI0031CEFFA6
MKMAKATEKDIDAAGEAMAVLNDISSGYYPASEGEDDAPTFFLPEDERHLRRFYDAIKATLNASPGWQGRVIGGMCYVILWDKNKIVDPESDTLDLHPRFEPKTAEQFEATARDLAKRARAAGFVITIDQRPEPPLAMGRHSDVVTIRPTIEVLRGGEHA